MSYNILNTVQFKTFESDVHHEFIAQGGQLRDTVRVKTTGGESHQFINYGAMEMTEHAVNTEVLLTNPPVSKVTITITRYAGRVPCDEFLKSEVPYDALAELKPLITAACRRKEDQIIINALAASSSSKTVAKNISGSNDNLNVAMIAQASLLLDEDDVPGTDRYIVAGVRGKHHLTQETDVKNIDTNSVRTLVNGSISSFYGFDFKFIGKNGKLLGLPLAGNDRTNFAYNKTAVGYVLNRDHTMLVEFNATTLTHEIIMYFSAEAGVIDPLGVVEITTDES